MSDWLNKFRDDPEGTRWLEKLREDPPGQGWPRNILLFSCLLAGSLVLGLAATAIGYERLVRLASPAEILLPEILVLAFFGVFIWLIAWRCQQWAVWVLGIFCAARFLFYLPSFPYIEPLSVRYLSAVYFALQAAAFWFIFTPEARRYLAKGPRHPPRGR